jgi:flagellar basal-body rod protein FlgB
MLNRLTDTLDFQGQALTLRAERQRLLASNIANADTPGFVARDMDFATTLRQATAGSGAGPMATAGGHRLPVAANGLGNGTTTVDLYRRGVATLSTTSNAHFPVALGEDGSDRSLLYAQPAQSNLDGNTVDMDRERANFVDNSVKYEATLRFLNGSVRTMLDAIKGQ